MTKLISSIRQFSLLGIFLCTLFVPPVVTYMNFVVEIPVQENRILTPRPKFPTSWKALSEWPKDFEAYYSDHFGFRTWFLYLYNSLQVRILKQSPTRKVIVGKDKWLYLASTLRTVPLAKPQKDVLLRKMLQFQSEAEQVGASYFFFIAPNKVSIYPEHLPWNVGIKGVLLEGDNWKRFSPEGHLLNYVNMFSVLQHVRQKKLVYFQAGTHWTDTGTHFVYRRLINRMRKADVLGHPLPVRRSPPAPAGHASDLALILGMEKFFEEYISVVDPMTYNCEEEFIENFMGQTWSTKHWSEPYQVSCGSGKGTALVIGDSFMRSTKLWKFLSPHFKKSIYVHRGYASVPDNYKWLLANVKPTVVVYEIVERALGGSLILDNLSGSTEE